eukprot:jgi/Mesvir1/21757/Mv04162-RA.1
MATVTLVVHWCSPSRPPGLASPSASPEPKRSRSAEPPWEEISFDVNSSGYWCQRRPSWFMEDVFYGSCTRLASRPLQRQTLDLREEAELAKRSLNAILKNFDMEEGAPPLLLIFDSPADKISFLRRRKRLENTHFTVDDDLTLAQQQRRRELWPTYLQLRQTKAGQPVYWKGAAIYVGHKPWQATPSTTAAPATPAPA